VALSLGVLVLHRLSQRSGSSIAPADHDSATNGEPGPAAGRPCEAR
jgi:hypothetical protein